LEVDVQVYAQTTGNQLTNSGSWTAIPGLTITLPGGVQVMATVILSVPLPYATGNDFPGGNFGIEVNGTISPVVGGFTYNEQQPQATGRIPTTLVVGVPLTPSPQTVTAVWSGVRGSTVILDSPATLTGLLG
jgi:hypothetical protein